MVAAGRSARVRGTAAQPRAGRQGGRRRPSRSLEGGVGRVTLSGPQAPPPPASPRRTMPLRTAAEYVESLRDERTVYFQGERVPDVTAHPVIARAIRHASVDFD